MAFEANGWSLLRVPEGSGGGFQNPGFDDSGFFIGGARYLDYRVQTTTCV